MNFLNLYTQAEKDVRLGLLSMWTPGHHPMRQAVENVLAREPLMAEPVFESMFPWTTTESSDWRGSLSDSVVEKLAIGSKFLPYTHQAESWKETAQGNSIVVTSGTGSGKTECFMYPVLSDIFAHKEEGGIQALFLYPLNALMEDQRNRMEEMCKALALTFAVYNGSTPERGGGSTSRRKMR